MEALSRGVREEQTVVALSLDWLQMQIPPPRVLKIDVKAPKPKC